MLRIILVDDHEMFLAGVAQVLAATGEIKIAAQAHDGKAGVEAAVRHQPDLVLMDIQMPVMNGVEATRQIKQRCPNTRVVILSVSDLDKDLFEAVKAGADGYLLKNLGPTELVNAVRAAGAGEAPLSSVMAARLLKEFRSGRTTSGSAPAAQLTVREIEVLQFATRGLTYKEIADRLFVAESTVKNHMRHIMEKLHLRNRSEAIRYAFSEGLVPPEPDAP